MPLTLCFDLDGTLCTNTFGAYEDAEPFPWAIARLNALAATGHRIVIFTARGTATGLDWDELTRGQLARWGVRFDELRFGKPSAEIYIDDRAISADTWHAGETLCPPEAFLTGEAVIAIPARLRSSRLPRKMLIDIGGQSLLQRTHEVAVAAGCGPVVVLTDDPEVAAEAEGFGADVLMTDPALESGTARIAAVAAQLGDGVVVNLQGDAPLTDPAVIAGTAAEALRSGAPVTMPVYRIEREADVHDPAVVKVARAHDGRTLYCSRSPVPHLRDAHEGGWAATGTLWGHPGIYAYSRGFLDRFETLPASPLEDAERLEQLRWLEAGLRIQTFEVPPQGPSVDTPADLERVRELFLARETS